MLALIISTETFVMLLQEQWTFGKKGGQPGEEPAATALHRRAFLSLASNERTEARKETSLQGL